jgi:hypothetical protein
MQCSYITSLAACILNLGGIDANMQVSTEALLPHNLVEARVAKVLPQDGRYRAFFEVTHVYKGHDDLSGKTFAVTANVSFGSQGMPVFVPPLKLGDTVIWLLRRDADTLEHVPEGIRMKHTRDWLPIPLPARQGDEHPVFPFSDVLAFAKAVEKTVNAPPQKRYTLLEEFALSDRRAVATWAMHALVEADPEGGADFLRQLFRRPEPTALQKILADQVLSALDETGWRTSQDRLALYRKWVTAPLPEDAAASLVGSLNLMLQHPPFPVEAVLELVEAAIENEKLPTKSRARATSLFLDVRRYSEERQRVFQFLLALLKRTDIPEIELAAAGVLRHALPEEVQRHREEVLAAQPSVQNETAASLLQEALAGDSP